MKLKTYLETSKYNQFEFAGIIKVTPAMVTYLLQGKKKPGLGLAIRISQATKGKVRPEDWID